MSRLQRSPTFPWKMSTPLSVLGDREGGRATGESVLMEAQTGGPGWVPWGRELREAAGTPTRRAAEREVVGGLADQHSGDSLRLLGDPVLLPWPARPQLPPCNTERGPCLPGFFS